MVLYFLTSWSEFWEDNLINGKKNLIIKLTFNF